MVILPAFWMGARHISVEQHVRNQVCQQTGIVGMWLLLLHTGDGITGPIPRPFIPSQTCNQCFLHMQKSLVSHVSCV